MINGVRWSCRCQSATTPRAPEQGEEQHFCISRVLQFGNPARSSGPKAPALVKAYLARFVVEVTGLLFKNEGRSAHSLD